MCNDISFRLDYFSIGDSWKNCAVLIRKLYPNVPFETGNLTEEEWNIINVDNISDSLSLPISDITKRKCIKFGNVPFGGQSATIYVSMFFLFIFVESDNKEIKLETNEKDDAIVKCLVEANDINIMNVSCNVNCGKVEAIAELKEELDGDAFPDINDNDIQNSSYVDSRIYDNCLVSVNRLLRKPKTGDKYEMMVNVHAEQIGLTDNILETFGTLLDYSIKDVTRVLK